MWRETASEMSGFDEISLACSDRPLEIRGDDHSFLRARVAAPEAGSSVLRTVDLFAGCGAMSLGLSEAAAANGFKHKVALAVEADVVAASVFKDNFRNSNVETGRIEDIFDAPGNQPLTLRERQLMGQVGDVDLVLAGPPCQGHSDLNNFSRRDDPRNSLYAYVARAAFVLKPRFLIIENVRGLAHDKSRVLQFTTETLQDAGYQVSEALVDLTRLGVPQKRIRHILVASRCGTKEVQTLLAGACAKPRGVRWAIGDLMKDRAEGFVEQPSRPSAANKARMEYLFREGLYDLPNSERPPCHRDKVHSYASVYGRLRWEEPAQTITSGFYSMCMGRYVHPAQPRTLTAREAARLQFIPDFFRFDQARSRTNLARLIGNAVPPKLTFALGHSLLAAANLR